MFSALESIQHKERKFRLSCNNINTFDPSPLTENKTLFIIMIYKFVLEEIIMQKGYKRNAKYKAVLHFFIGIIFMIIIALIAWFMLTQMDYSDKLDPDTSMRPYVETTPEVSPSVSPSAHIETTPTPTPTPAFTPTPSPTPTPTPTPEPTPEPTSIAAESYSPMRADLKLPDGATIDNGVIGITHSYRSTADGNKVLQLQGYGYVNDPSFDGTTAQIYLVIRQESSGDRIVAMATMKPGITGMEHADAQCVNASSSEFEAFLYVDQFANDIYSLDMVINYKINGEDQLVYIEYPEEISFTVLNGQILSEVPLTEAE